MLAVLLALLAVAGAGYALFRDRMVLARAAHATADAHADAAHAATAEALAHASDPTPSGVARFRDAWRRAVGHAEAAHAANAEAIAQTTQAKPSTAADHADVQASAQQVIQRDVKIKAALTALGVGQCGARTYPRVPASGRDALLKRLRGDGMTVTVDAGGSAELGPWKIETHEPGLPLVDDVVLRAVWDAAAETLHLIVIAGKGSLVTCDKIWAKIEPALHETVGS